MIEGPKVGPEGLPEGSPEGFPEGFPEGSPEGFLEGLLLFYAGYLSSIPRILCFISSTWNSESPEIWMTVGSWADGIWELSKDR